jgi:hypothetical protein
MVQDKRRSQAYRRSPANDLSHARPVMSTCLFSLEYQLISTRFVEIRRYSRIARLISRNCERAILNLVYRVRRFANILWV